MPAIARVVCGAAITAFHGSYSHINFNSVTPRGPGSYRVRQTVAIYYSSTGVGLSLAPGVCEIPACVSARLPLPGSVFSLSMNIIN